MSSVESDLDEKSEDALAEFRSVPFPALHSLIVDQNALPSSTEPATACFLRSVRESCSAVCK